MRVLGHMPQRAAAAERVVEWIGATKKRLTTVHFTHGHGDHFFGLNTILTAFPEAKAVALPEVAPFAQEQVAPGYMAFGMDFSPTNFPSIR